MDRVTCQTFRFEAFCTNVLDGICLSDWDPAYGSDAIFPGGWYHNSLCAFLVKAPQVSK